MNRPPLTVTPGRHPFEIGAFAGTASAGLWGLLVPGGRSNAVDQSFPSWFVEAYYAQLAAFGLIALGVLLVRDQDVRMRLERCACYGVGYSAACYAVCAFYSTGAPAGTAALMVGWVSIPACTYRIVQISLDRRRIRLAQDAAQSADPSPLADPSRPFRRGREGT